MTHSYIFKSHIFCWILLLLIFLLGMVKIEAFKTNYSYALWVQSVALLLFKIPLSTYIEPTAFVSERNLKYKNLSIKIFP